MSQHITVIEYSPLWKNKYKEESLLIRNILADNCIATVSAALLTEKGNIYVGVCIDTACSLGMCAERNAIANMITNGECTIQRVIAIGQNGNAIPPCGACREFMTQLALEKYHSIQIMLDYENKKVVALGDITSNWWI